RANLDGMLSRSESLRELVVMQQRIGFGKLNPRVVCSGGALAFYFGEGQQCVGGFTGAYLRSGQANSIVDVIGIEGGERAKDIDGVLPIVRHDGRLRLHRERLFAWKAG